MKKGLDLHDEIDPTGHTAIDKATRQAIAAVESGTREISEAVARAQDAITAATSTLQREGQPSGSEVPPIDSMSRAVDATRDVIREVAQQSSMTATAAHQKIRDAMESIAASLQTTPRATDFPTPLPISPPRREVSTEKS